MVDSQQHKDHDDLVPKLLKQQKELSESLKYASYIQKALFPKKNQIKKYFPQSFVLFIPRDIVSGDFYWIYRNNNKSMVAVGDCTGHGVPGAFMSILGISFLNQIVANQKLTDASEILNILREHMMSALGQTGEESEQKDGIDMALCIIDYNTHTMQFSGAFNPVYIVREDNLTQMEGDKMPIGIAAEFERSFQNKTFKLKSGDMIYLFSDGFVDQFGGQFGKKYKYQPFRNFLLGISGMPVNQQKTALIEELDRWKGSLQQLDDITVIGIRYH